MRYKKSSVKKVRGSHILIISCGNCKTDLVKYQKQGRGNLLRMHIDRVIESNVSFDKQLKCFNCENILGTKIYHKLKKKEVYKMNRSTFNTRESN